MIDTEVFHGGLASVRVEKVGRLGVPPQVVLEDLAGAVAFTPAIEAGSVPAVELDLASDYFDLGALMPVETSSSATPAPARAPPKDRVIPDLALPMDQLRRIDAAVDVAVKRLEFRRTTVEDVVVRGRGAAHRAGGGNRSTGHPGGVAGAAPGG